MADEADINASIDSFGPDGQQERQPGVAITRERVRNLNIQITPVSADQNIQLDTNAVPNPSLAPANTGRVTTQRPLTLTKGDIPNQAKLAWKPAAGVTNRGAGPSSVGVAPVLEELGAPASPVVTGSRMDPGSFRPRSPAALRRIWNQSSSDPYLEPRVGSGFRDSFWQEMDLDRFYDP